MDYERVNLASKIGGVCDIDQVYILNSNDGPTTGQCGPLTGYSSKSYHEHTELGKTNINLIYVITIQINGLKIQN